jgi:hypothetical protein
MSALWVGEIRSCRFVHGLILSWDGEAAKFLSKSIQFDKGYGMGEAWRALGGYSVGIVPIFIVLGPPLHRRLRDIAADSRLLPHNIFGYFAFRPADSPLQHYKMRVFTYPTKQHSPRRK